MKSRDQILAISLDFKNKCSFFVLLSLLLPSPFPPLTSLSFTEARRVLKLILRSTASLSRSFPGRPLSRRPLLMSRRLEDRSPAVLSLRFEGEPMLRMRGRGGGVRFGKASRAWILKGLERKYSRKYSGLSLRWTPHSRLTNDQNETFSLSTVDSR